MADSLSGLESIGNSVVSRLGVLVGVEKESITLSGENTRNPAVVIAGLPGSDTNTCAIASAGVDNGLVVVSLRSLVLGVIGQVHANVEFSEGNLKAKGSKASDVLGDSSRELANNQVSLDTEAMVWDLLLQE